MKKKKEIKIIWGSNKYPPPATQPTRGGIAPTNDPGIMASGEIFLSGVYTPLYQRRLSNPNDNTSKPLPKNNKKDPIKINNIEIIRTEEAAILPDGIGRFLVLSIKASVLLSWKWFNAADPQAKKRIPIVGNNIFRSIEFVAAINPNIVVIVTNIVILIFVISASIWNWLFKF